MLQFKNLEKKRLFSDFLDDLSMDLNSGEKMFADYYSAYK